MPIGAPQSFSTGTIFPVVQSLLIVKNEFLTIAEEEIDTIFLQEHALPITYLHVSGELRIYRAINDEPYTEANVSDSSVDSRQKVVTFGEAAFIRTPKRGDVVTIKGIKYQVERIRPDGTGMVDITCTQYGQ